MNSESVLTVAAAVVAFTQLLKWSKLVSDARGPVIVILFSLIGTAVHMVATVEAFDRRLVASFFAFFVNVALSAAGSFGFTRALPEAVTATSQPPSGAGSNPTT